MKMMKTYNRVRSQKQINDNINCINRKLQVVSGVRHVAESRFAIIKLPVYRILIVVSPLTDLGGIHGIRIVRVFQQRHVEFNGNV